jgi:hypothetical protein
MSMTPEAALESLRDVLRAMPAEGVRSPTMPVADFDTEARRVLNHVANHSLAAELARVGINDAAVEAIGVACAALTKAESDWRQVRAGRLPADLAELEDSLEGLRSVIVARFASTSMTMSAPTRWPMRCSRAPG